MRAVRAVTAIGTVLVLLLLVIVVTVPNEASADTNLWTTDGDWLAGTLDSNVVLKGTGPASYLELRRADFPDWMKMAPSTVPPRRDSACLAWIDVDDSFLMFGGSGPSGSLGDTWKYSWVNDQWTLLSLPTHPSNRSKAGCAYDPVGQDVVLFGGFDGTGWSTETWKFDAVAGTWGQVFPTGMTPRNMWSTPLTYDSQQGKIMMLGRNSISVAMETWAYDPAANSWTNRNPGSSPSARDGHAIAYTPLANLTFLFSGAEGLTIHCDLWSYSYPANTWTHLRDCVPNEDPNGRVGHGMVARLDCGGLLLFGGFDGVAYPPETWCYVSAFSDFSNPLTTGSPGGRRDIQLATSTTDASTVFFGGSNTADGLKNDTWAFAKGYVSGTDAVWTSSSTPVDTGCTNPTYGRVYWNSTSNPVGAILRFQIATSMSLAGPWTFTGPGGLPGAHYTTWGQQIDSSNNNKEYFRMVAKLKTANGRVTPRLEDLEVTWACPPTPPRITNTNPVNGVTNVPITAPIWVNFSESMNTQTVLWTISGGVTATDSWTNNNRTLELTPTTPFRDCTGYTAQITAGKDKNDNLDLVPGPVPNPWNFTTTCINPYIVSTDPADRDVVVPLDKVVVVVFSEPMDVLTVTWSITGGLTLSGSWNGNRDIVSLSHASNFIQCTGYTIEILTGQDDQGLPLVPGPVPNPWSFFTVCPSPYVASTSPVSGASNVPLTDPIVVTFSKAMNVGTVTYLFSDPGIAFDPPSWSGNVLTLAHPTPFAQATTYTMNITGGRDTLGNSLVPGPVPNPWSFTTVDLPPVITCESPPDGAVDVPLNAPIIVCFSEPVDITTISVSISPSIALVGSWNPTSTNVTLDHAPFAPCTTYAVQIGGVAPGPLPNPWTFTTVCSLGAPRGLEVRELSPSSVLLLWRAVAGASSYRVYASSNRFAPFPSGWTLLADTTLTQYTATGHLADGVLHYYLVRAASGVTEGPNSTMGLKDVLSFGFSGTTTNIAWFSLPYNSTYRRASDIATRLGSVNVDLIGKWDVARQATVIYYFSRGAWRGVDFLINPGDGLFLGTRRAFTWAFVGTDLDASLTFVLRPSPSANQNWIGLPYTSSYRRASDVSDELTFAKIREIGMWDPVTQSVIRWHSFNGTWIGSNFLIPQGAGIYIVLQSSFTWTPALLTPWRP